MTQLRVMTAPVSLLPPVLLCVALAVALAACSRDEPMLGTVLQASDPAPEFQLRDQFGRSVALADYRGKVAVVTFLYTYCPDICPIVTSHLKQAHRMLGEDAARVGFVAISADPQRDTTERAYAFSEEWGMLKNWAFLVGDEAELAPVWKAYYVAPSIDEHGQTPTAAPTPQGNVGALREGIAAPYTVSHSAPVYLIDREGVMRALFTLPFEPQAVVHDIRLLLE